MTAVAERESDVATSTGATRGHRTAALARFRGSRPGMVGLVLLIIFTLMAVAYPILTRTLWDPNLTPWHLLIIGGAAISLLTASFYLVAIGIHTAFDTPKVKRT